MVVDVTEAGERRAETHARARGPLDGLLELDAEGEEEEER